MYKRIGAVTFNIKAQNHLHLHVCMYIIIAEVIFASYKFLFHIQYTRPHKLLFILVLLYIIANRVLLKLFYL